MAEPHEISSGVYYSSLLLIIFIYCTSIFVIIELKQFIPILDFRNNFWQCRQPILNISYIISFLFLLYIVNPLTLFLANVYGLNSQYTLFANDIADMLIFLVFFPRAWILWFDRAFVDNMKNWLWRREINIQDTNFLIRHRRHLHSPHRIVYSIYLLLVAPIFTMLHILPHYEIIPLYCHIMRAILLVCLLWTTFTIVSKISITTDEHNIRPELLYTVKTTGVLYVLGDILSIICEIISDEHVSLLIEILFVCIAGLYVIYYACHWTRLKFEFTRKLQMMKQMKGKHTRRSSFSSFLSKRIQFRDIMEHRNGVESFCNHLANEFGLESMIFLLEVTQFKAIIRRLSNNKLRDNIPDLVHDIHRHTSIDQRNNVINIDEENDPISFPILSATNILNMSWLPIDPRMFSLTPYQIALYIYDKYVEESADLCINISFGIRKGIYRYFAEYTQRSNNASLHDIQLNENMETLNPNDDLVKLYTVYDEGFTEIWRLLQTDSFLRFKTTEEFRRLVSVIYPNEATSANKSIVQMVDEQINLQLIELKKQNTKLDIVIEDPHTPMKKPTLLPKLSSNKNTRGIVMVMHNDFTTQLTSVQSESIDINDVNSKDRLITRSPILCSPPTNEMEQMDGNIDADYKFANDMNPITPAIEGNTNINTHMKKLNIQHRMKTPAIKHLPVQNLPLQYEQKSLPWATDTKNNESIGSFASTMLKLTKASSLPSPLKPMKMCNNDKENRFRVYSNSGAVDDFIIS
eukprot:223106_1